MIKVANFIVDSIENFFNSEDFLRYIMLGESLIDYHITDPLLIEKGFLGFRITKCKEKYKYKKLYVYVNTDYFLNRDLELNDYNCLLILLESGMRDINEFYIPHNIKIQADKSNKFKFSNSVFHFDSVDDFKSFSVGILNSTIYINSVFSLEELDRIKLISNFTRNIVIIENLRLYIEDSKYWYYNSVSNYTKLLNDNYTAIEDITLQYEIKNMNIVLNVNQEDCLYNLYTVLFNHFSDLSLGHINLRDKGIVLNICISDRLYERYLNRRNFKDFMVIINDYLFEWYKVINVNILESSRNGMH